MDDAVRVLLVILLTVFGGGGGRVVVVARADELSNVPRRDAVVSMSHNAISTIRELLCGKVDNEHKLTLGIDVGETERDYFSEVFKDLRYTRENRLLGAASTDSYDFRKFADVDAVVGLSAMSYWQEITAAYPQTRIILILGEPFRKPSPEETLARLQRCANATDRDAVRETIEAFGSGCPSVLQKAKVQDQVVAELLENAPSIRVFDKDMLELDRRKAFWQSTAASWLRESQQSALVACPGMGGTATKSLASALRKSGLERVDHNQHTVKVLATAAEDDDFRWHEVDFGDAVLDTPIPGFWWNLVDALPRSNVILTIRLAGYSRDYSSHFFVGGGGREPRRLQGAEARCFEMQTCLERCLDGAGNEEDWIEAGLNHCRLKHTEDHDVLNYARHAAVSLLSPSETGARQQEYKFRLPVYYTDCPSNIQSLKVFLNNNRHVLRRVPEDRVLVMDVTKGDGYELLCRFLGSTQGECRQNPLPRFPRSKNVTTQDRHRRLHAPCVCH